MRAWFFVLHLGLYSAAYIDPGRFCLRIDISGSSQARDQMFVPGPAPTVAGVGRLRGPGKKDSFFLARLHSATLIPQHTRPRCCRS